MFKCTYGTVIWVLIWEKQNRAKEDLVSITYWLLILGKSWKILRYQTSISIKIKASTRLF